MAPALYLQIKQHILDGIRERHYQAGDRIPTEAALCEQFAVSRMTVNKALRELVAEGSTTSKALDYSLKRWVALTRYLEDGAVPIDNNQIENLIRPWALGPIGSAEFQKKRCA